MAWGWGMKERFILRRAGTPWRLSSSPWRKIFEKPYRSGAVVYVSNDNQTYYLGTYHQAGIFELDRKRIRWTCDESVFPKYTHFGEQVSSKGTSGGVTLLDPRAPHFPSFINTSPLSEITPVSPPPSKYYAGVRYLGTFGVLKGRGRGSDVGFVSSEQAREPRFALNTYCD
jgi:hypothetical protein